MRCLAAKPIVNGIEKDLEGQAKVIRLDMLSSFGRKIAGRFEVSSIPTLLVLDGEQNVIYRHSGLPDRQKVVGLLAP